MFIFYTNETVRNWVANANNINNNNMNINADNINNDDDDDDLRPWLGYREGMKMRRVGHTHWCLLDASLCRNFMLL